MHSMMFNTNCMQCKPLNYNRKNTCTVCIWIFKYLYIPFILYIFFYLTAVGASCMCDYMRKRRSKITKEFFTNKHSSYICLYYSYGSGTSNMDGRVLGLIYLLLKNTLIKGCIQAFFIFIFPCF